MKVCPKSFPLEWASSIVAVVSQQNDPKKQSDPLREAALELLRDLSLVNYAVVAAANGFKVLLEAVLDKDLQAISESIILCVLHLLNEPVSR